MSKSHYAQQKLLIENFNKWISEEKCGEEEIDETAGHYMEAEPIEEDIGVGTLVLTIQTIRTIANAMQTIVRSERGRKAISSIPRYGPEILDALDKYGDEFSQWFQTKSEEIKSKHPIFYRLVYYPYLMIGYVADFTDMAALELTNYGAKYIKAKQTDKATDEKEKAELERAKKERIGALQSAEQVRDNLLKDIDRTQDALDMETPDDVKRIRVSDPSSTAVGVPTRSRAKKFKFEPGKK